MIGKTLSHYKVIEKIGQGGMGEVYRAQDTNLSRESLDEFRPTLSPAEVQRLLLRTYRWIQPQEPQWRHPMRARRTSSGFLRVPVGVLW